jgi:endonuclease/exonuclease/phosphatase family metal-dependent hydrolase
MVGCTGGSGSSGPTPTDAATPEPLSLSVLVFNVEYGGTRATDAVMADVDADVVGVLESYNRLPRIARAAGYPYYDVGLQILSKYPIWEPSGAHGLYAYVEVRPGQAVAVINAHLDYVQDGPNRLARGVPVADVLATERQVRLASVRKLLPSATTLIDDGWPVLFTGDLNEPSHLDWTAATADQHDGIGPVAWPVSRALVGAGLQDSYRVAYPDPVADPGNTWGGVAGGHGSPRRIDFAYVGGPVEVESSEVVGERGAADVDSAHPRWTSDHRAVLSEVRLVPAPIPTTVALSTRLPTVGDRVTVSYRLPDGTGAGAVTLRGPSSRSREVAGGSGTWTFGTRRMGPGAYTVGLEDRDGETLARNRLHLRPDHARVALTTDRTTYDVGEPIGVRWTDGPGNRWDWIGVYRAGAADPAKDDYLVWGYTGGHDAGALPPRVDGRLVLGRDHQGKPWPLPPGRYVVHYLLTDQYVSAGTARFAVRP